jgi:cytochrome c/WD40 domain-containing protein
MLVLASIAIAPSNVRAQQKVTYDDNVLPIVTQRCSRCHSEEKQKGGLLATTYAGILAGSSGGAVLVAGEPEQSNLYLSITHQREPNMPPGGEKIPQNEIDTIRKWIEGGLLENGGSKAKAKKKKSGPDLKAAIVTLGKPAEPPPLPKDLLLEPVVTSARAGALESLAANPWAPLVALGGQQQVLLVQWGSSTATNAAATAAAGAPAAASPPELVGILPFPEGLPQCLAFSRDGRTLIASGGRGATSGRVVGWSVADGKRLFEVGAEDDSILAADISPDQKFVAFGTTDKLVKVVTTAGEKAHQLKKHTDWVTAVAFSPDGVLLATGDRNGNLYVWEAESGREYQTLAGHTAAITGLAWRDDANVLASSSEDGTIRLWEMQEGKQIKNWGAHGGGALAVAFAHDGRLASCGRDHAVKVWKGDGALEKQLDGLTELGLRVAFDPDGREVVAGDWNGVIKVWSAADGKVVGDVQLNPPRIADRLAAASARFDQLKPIAESAAQARAKAEADAKEPLAQLATSRAANEAASKKLKESEAALAALPPADPGAVLSNEERARRESALNERRSLHDKLVEAATAARTAAAQSPGDAALQQSAADAEQAAAHAQEAAQSAEQSLAALVKASEQAKARAEAEAAVAAAKADAEPKAAEVAKLEAQVKPLELTLAETRKTEEAAAIPFAQATRDVAHWQAAQKNVEWHQALGEVESAEAARAAVPDVAKALESARTEVRTRAARVMKLEAIAAELRDPATGANDDPPRAAALKSIEESIAHANGSVDAACEIVLQRRTASAAVMQSIAAARQARLDQEARIAALPKIVEERRSKVAPAEAALAAAQGAVDAAAPVVDSKRAAAAEVERHYRERLAAAR